MIIYTKRKFKIGDILKHEGLKHEVINFTEGNKFNKVEINDIGELLEQVERVVTYNNKTFDVSDTSLSRIDLAIKVSELSGIIEHDWKLSKKTKGPRIQKVTVDELKVVLQLGMQKLASEVLNG